MKLNNSNMSKNLITSSTPFYKVKEHIFVNYQASSKESEF